MSNNLVLSEVFPPAVGGSGRYLWEIYRRTPLANYVVAAGHVPGGEEFDREIDLSVRRTRLHMPDPGVLGVQGFVGYWRAFEAARRIVRSEGVSRVHCARCVPEGWIGLMLKRFSGLPYVCYAHGEEVNLNSAGEGHGVMSSRQLRWMTGCVLKHAEFVIANSRNTRRILVEDWGMGPDRVRLLQPGVDTRAFRPSPPDLSVRSRLGWAGRTVILTVSRLQKRKGHERMIRTLGRIRTRIPDVLYAIVGDGGESEALKQLVRREHLERHVVFHGVLADEEVVRCYQQCDLFVLPNRQVGEDIEGFGMVLLEAQACGKPVVAGASGGTSETMRVPETGRIVHGDGPEELEAVVLELLSDRDRLEAMGKRGRDWVVSHFDWEIVGRRAHEILEGGIARISTDHAVDPTGGHFLTP